MKTISHFLPILIGLAVAASPVTTDAKLKKDEREKKKSAGAEVQKKQHAQPSKKAAPHKVSPRKPQARQKVAPQKQRSAQTAHRSKSLPSKSAQKPTVTHRPGKRNPAKDQTARSTNRHQPLSARQTDKTRRDITDATREHKKHRSAATSKKGKTAENKSREIDAPHADASRAGKKEAREERREARQETAEQRQKRAARLREKQRVLQHHKHQIAERRERARDRVERFREHRRDRFSALSRQRRAIRATRAEARREYVREVREEIRDYWEDRAEEVRDRIGDRCDNLFDDDWWEHRRWRRGPLVVSDPWWWWRPARFDSINVFIGAGWSEPIVYDYGTDVIYDADLVQVRGEPVGTPIEYSRQIVQLANPVATEVTNAPVSVDDWRALGVWALVQEAQGDAVMFFQLSVDREGLVSGAYTNVVSGEELPVSGQVDRTTQRVAWHVGEQTSKVFEAGLANLTQDQASCLVHVAPGEMQNWLLVRLPDPTLPDEPRKVGDTGATPSSHLATVN
jgi:hypothetical protein